MMRNDVFFYSCAEVNRCELADGDCYEVVAKAANASYGCYVYKGKLEVVDSDDPTCIGITYDPFRAGTEVLTKGRVAYRAHGDTGWLCIHDNGTGPRELRVMCVEQVGTLPAGWGFFVAKGFVTTSDGLLAGENSYYRPRHQDIGLSGTAALLLIK